ncbi:TPM domain-containing protein [Mycobacterium shigaense]|uniref:TPM domain-containing protein n=1 Tax=Mycobacterium shigaense TaxID=722731 RepID=UPI000E58898E|nr:TPM domain-containing protein [Mycobacterium shigaense]
MRIARLAHIALTILTAALLLAPPVGAQPPSKLLDHLTDDSAVLTSSDKAAIGSAIDRLFSSRHVQLWVVYVDNFNRFQPDNWAKQARDASGMGDDDVLLAVATNTKKYAFSVPPKAQGPLTANELNSLQSNKIEPAINSRDWSGAAIAAADGLNKPDGQSAPASKPKRNWLPIVIGVVAVVVVVVLVLLLLRARRRRRAALHVSPHDGQRVDSLGPALSIAEARLSQISNYIAKHRQSIGAQTRTQLDEAKRYAAQAHSAQSSDSYRAIADANRASTLAAEAQALANADVQAAHRTPRRR